MLNDIKKDAQTRMAKSVEALRHDLTRLRTGRAHPSMVDHLMVPYHGTTARLSQVASVDIADATALLIKPFDKAMTGMIEKAILKSNLGLTPHTAGQIIRLNLPTLTQERRKELVRQVATFGESSKVSVRNTRREALAEVKALLKSKVISEDEERQAEKNIQRLTDETVRDIETMIKKKEGDLSQ